MVMDNMKEINNVVEPEIVIQELTGRINELTETNQELRAALEDAMGSLKNVNEIIKTMVKYKMIDTSRLPVDKVEEVNAMFGKMKC